MVPCWIKVASNGDHGRHSLIRLFFLTRLAAVTKHPQRPSRDQPLRGEPELPAGAGGPHPGGEQQQLQRDFCLHAHPQSGHDHCQQAGSLNLQEEPSDPTSVLAPDTKYSIYFLFFFFLSSFITLYLHLPGGL